MSDVRPFLTVVVTPTRALAASLPAIATEQAPSPWSPKPVAAPTGIDADAIRAEAKICGEAEGLRQTEGLRARLGQLIAELETARASLVAPTAELVADATGCVVEAWAGQTDSKTLFEPIIGAWLARTTEAGAIARVHPDDVIATAEAIGDAKLTVIGDPALARGEIRLRGGALELHHNLQARLGELRVAIAAAIEGAK